MTLSVDDILATLEAAYELRTREAHRFFKPYAPQRDFFAFGNTKRERLLMAGNQTGKTQAGAYEAMCHLTGLYPDWWEGKRFGHPTKGWAGGEGGLLVRDVLQAKLCGTPGSDADFGTGMIPKKALLGKVPGHGVSDGYDNIRVRHSSGGTSTLAFKTYDQGRSKWQSATLDFIWTDEEPPADIYSEALTRLTGDGIIYTTCTPLLGYTTFIKRFTHPETPEQLEDRAVVRMGLRHAEHFTEEEKKRRLAGFPAHERAARENGDPLLGEGHVFEDVVPKDITTEMRLNWIPKHWPLLWGIDFGINHPFAAVLIAWDRDTDCIYVLHTIRMVNGIPVTHAAAMKKIAASVPVAWPHDGAQREHGSGEPLAKLYKKQGLRMLDQHATHPTGGYSTEAGIRDMIGLMRGNSFKVPTHLADWWDEFGSYHRKDGKIVKVNDDLMSATRIAVMARRFAKTVAVGPGVNRPQAKMADGVENFSYF